MKYLCLDFETVDKYITLDLGAGWVFSLNNPETSLFRTIGYSYLTLDNGTVGQATYRSTDRCKCELEALLIMHDAVIMHNAQYDLGCLRTLGINIDKLLVYDTKIMSFLYDSAEFSHSLDSLSKKYLPKQAQKMKSFLVDVVRKHSLIKIKETAATYDKRAQDWAYQNMDIIQDLEFEGMAEYAKQDVIATAGLFLHFLTQGYKKITLEQAGYYSKIQKVCVKMREKGVSISMKNLNRAIEELTPEVESMYKKMVSVFGDINFNSPAQLAESLHKLGFVLPRTEKGKPSVAKTWLVEHQDDVRIKLIFDYRAAHKVLKDFLLSIKEQQQYTCPEALCGAERGKVFPEMNVFGARTGRFSSSHPNIQQIPSHDPRFGKLCRGIFVPNSNDNQWIKLDWASQEIRLQLNDALLIKAKGASELAEALRENPKLDFHAKVAEICHIDRKQAKTINLGLSYGMGEGKLCKSLNLPVINRRFSDEKGLEVVYMKAGREGKKILEAYEKNVPYLKLLTEHCIDRMRDRGFIKTIGGRFLRMAPGIDDSRNALNKRIQGSAADQCIAALLEAYDLGLDIKFPVHDEINIEGTEKEAKILKTIMENTIKLRVPMLAEIQIGNSWGTVEEVK